MSSITHDPYSTVEAVAVKAWVKDRIVYVELHDERIVSFPARKFSRLNAANDVDLGKVVVRAQGGALRWEDLDEDISVEGILQGIFEGE